MLERHTVVLIVLSTSNKRGAILKKRIKMDLAPVTDPSKNFVQVTGPQSGIWFIFLFVVVFGTLVPKTTPSVDLCNGSGQQDKSEEFVSQGVIGKSHWSKGLAANNCNRIPRTTFDSNLEPADCGFLRQLMEVQNTRDINLRDDVIRQQVVRCKRQDQPLITICVNVVGAQDVRVLPRGIVVVLHFDCHWCSPCINVHDTGGGILNATVRFPPPDGNEDFITDLNVGRERWCARHRSRRNILVASY